MLDISFAVGFMPELLSGRDHGADKILKFFLCHKNNTIFIFPQLPPLILVRELLLAPTSLLFGPPTFSIFKNILSHIVLRNHTFVVLVGSKKKFKTEV